MTKQYTDAYSVTSEIRSGKGFPCIFENRIVAFSNELLCLIPEVPEGKKLQVSITARMEVVDDEVIQRIHSVG